MVFQDPFGSLNPRRTVRRPSRSRFALQRDAPARAWLGMVTEILERVGLGPQYLDRFPIELTASEQQRVGIARALITSPKLVVLDEPTSTLDPTVREEILGLLRSLQSKHVGGVPVHSHDIMAVETSEPPRCSHVSRPHRGASSDGGHNGRPRHPYTRALMSAVLSPDPTRRLPRNLVLVRFRAR